MDRIVGEVTKNWPSENGDPELLSQKFELMIAVNKERGFALESWQYSKVVHPFAEMACGLVVCETIIAVFVACLEAGQSEGANDLD